MLQRIRRLMGVFAQLTRDPASPAAAAPRQDRIVHQRRPRFRFAASVSPTSFEDRNYQPADVFAQKIATLPDAPSVQTRRDEFALSEAILREQTRIQRGASRDLGAAAHPGIELARRQ